MLKKKWYELLIRIIQGCFIKYKFFRGASLAIFSNPIQKFTPAVLVIIPQEFRYDYCIDAAKFLLPILIGLVLGFITLLLAAQAWQGYRQSARARRWPSVQGRVLSAAVQARPVRVRTSIGIMRTRLATRFTPRVVYRYTVAGMLYQGARTRLGPEVLSSDTRGAEKAVQRCPPGTAVTVYYNPADPSESVLDPRPGPGTQLFALVAVLMAVLTILTVGIFVFS